ncbi:c-type cytochrome [Oxalicibacterium faecigallinarum]|uniref:c-type cytochrome n=1 Tax=Oxalicibacterium faecigallinarum TaxID=573741 RepID=UPI00280A6415|nr:c-type cytochrome [Oxalicibacterium faecigallinarum]
MPIYHVAPTWIQICSVALFLMATTSALAQTVAPSADIARGDIEQGRRLLDQYQCGACHAIPGIPAARGTAGPPLGQFGRRSYAAGRVPNTEALLARWIVNPHSMNPTTTMPAMGASEQEARDMAAYLLSLQ